MLPCQLLSGSELILRKTHVAKDELPSRGLKEYCPNNSWLENKLIDNQLQERFNFLQVHTIEKSCSISQAEWVPHLKKAKVLKKVGKSWDTVGHRLDNEEWLMPEEALFLIENCELQLFYQNVSLSIEDCYNIVFNEELCSFNEFRVYCYLSRAGFKVIRHSPSVSITRYEKQVHLDSIIQSQKRPPPDVSSDNDITIIDDDPPEEPASKNSSQSSIQCISPEKKSEIAETIILSDSDEDSDSDVVCISSPSYKKDKDFRVWYPDSSKSLRLSMEKFIDLCSDDEDDTVVEKKWNVRLNFDLIRTPKNQVLANIPNVKDQKDTLVVADKRLLPPNITPQYTEYKLNLNIRADFGYERYNNRNVESFDAVPRQGSQDLQPSFNEVFRQFPQNDYRNVNQFSSNNSQNPLLIKAQEMQAMAINMMLTSVRLMTAMSAGNHNPNELWELQQANRPPPLLGTPIRPLWSGGFQSHGFGFPRRPRPFFPRHHRHRFPHNRPNWNRRPTSVTPITPFSPEKQQDDVVVLSDGEEDVVICSSSKSDSLSPGIKNSSKRKNGSDSDPSKRFKIDRNDEGDAATLSDSSSCTLENQTSIRVNNLKKDPDSTTLISLSDSCSSLTGYTTNNRVVALKRDPECDTASNGSSCVMEGSAEVIKREASIASDEPVSKKVKTEPLVEIKSEPQIKVEPIPVVPDKSHFPLTSIKDEVGKPIETEKIDRSNNATENNNKETSEITGDSKKKNNLEQNKNLFKEIVPDHTATPSPSNESPKVSEVDETKMPSSSASRNVITEEDNDVNKISSFEGDEEAGNINSWEQFKSSDVNCEDKDADSLFNYQDCITYSDVLSTLKIFKKIETTKTKERFNVSFDVYISDGSFKKSLKLLPKYRVIILSASDEIPTTSEIEGLKIRYQDDIPFLFSIVFNERIAFYLYDKLSFSLFNI